MLIVYSRDVWLVATDKEENTLITQPTDVWVPVLCCLTLLLIIQPMHVSILVQSLLEPTIAASIPVLWAHGLATLLESARPNAQLQLLTNLLTTTLEDVSNTVLEI